MSKPAKRQKRTPNNQPRVEKVGGKTPAEAEHAAPTETATSKLTTTQKRKSKTPPKPKPQQPAPQQHGAAVALEPKTDQDGAADAREPKPTENKLDDELDNGAAAMTYGDEFLHLAKHDMRLNRYIIKRDGKQLIQVTYTQQRPRETHPAKSLT